MATQTFDLVEKVVHAYDEMTYISEVSATEGHWLWSINSSEGIKFLPDYLYLGMSKSAVFDTPLTNSTRFLGMEAAVCEYKWRKLKVFVECAHSNLVA